MSSKNLKPYTKGKSGNPAGRPKGAKNKATIFKEICKAQFDGKVEEVLPAVLDTLMNKAIEGDLKAIQMILDRIIPVSKAVDLETAGLAGKGVNITINALEVKNETETIEDRTIHGQCDAVPEISTPERKSVRVREAKTVN